MRTLTKTVRAIYHHGVLELREPLDVTEGEEVTVSVTPGSEMTLTERRELSDTEKRELLLSVAGGWKDIVDENFEEELYEMRRLKTRPEVEPWV